MPVADLHPTEAAQGTWRDSSGSGNEKLPLNSTGRNVRQTLGSRVGAFCLDRVGGKKREREREGETEERQKEIQCK